MITAYVLAVMVMATGTYSLESDILGSFDNRQECVEKARTVQRVSHQMPEVWWGVAACVAIELEEPEPEDKEVEV